MPAESLGPLESIDVGPAARIVHPKPTVKTIRQLYGTAFRCGAPTCGRPLYMVDGETGETSLNSHVAHIHARSQGGPRWKSGMSAKDNRSPANLILLCFEHAWQVDQSASTYPADKLREWKVAQLDESSRLQKSWTLTDAEIKEVKKASFDHREHGHAFASAAAALEAVTETGTLIAEAQRTRRGAAQVASEWRARQAYANARSLMFDSSTGERLPNPLPRSEVEAFESRIREALSSATDALEPRASRIKGLAHALGVESEMTPWTEWLSRVVSDLSSAAGRWPARGVEDDGQLGGAIDELTKASLALGQRARGLPAEEPPEQTSSDEVDVGESNFQRRLREHRDLLESARRWDRVDHLPYDADVFDALLESAAFAVDLPGIPGSPDVSLRETSSLAARVARNADDDTFLALVERAKLGPLAAASYLLWSLQGEAAALERNQVKATAVEAITETLAAEPWARVQVWKDNAFHARRVLDFTAHYVSEEHVRSRLEDAFKALVADEEFTDSVVFGLAEWAIGPGIKCRIRELPPWLPTDLLVAAIHTHAPDLRPVDDPSADALDLRRLAAQVLYASAQRQLRGRTDTDGHHR